jgi:hypothetical protein
MLWHFSSRSFVYGVGMGPSPRPPRSMHLLQLGCGGAVDAGRGDDSNAMSDGLVLYWNSCPVKTPYGECGCDFIIRDG